MSYVKRTWVQEDTWICTHCQAENLGRHLKCQKCGAKKGSDNVDVQSSPDPSKAVSDPSLLAIANGGADWECSYCHGKTRNADGKCVKCTAPREEPSPKAPESPQSPANEPVATQVPPPRRTSHRPKERSPETIAREMERNERLLRAAESERQAREAAERRHLRNQILLWGIPTAALLALLVWVLVPHIGQAKVYGLDWEYTANLRQKTLMSGEGWGPRVNGTSSPSSRHDGYGPRGDSFDVVCQGKYYGTENCHPYDCNFRKQSYDCNCHSYECNCHKSCSKNGNGFSTCSESCSTCEKCSTCYREVHDTCYEQCNVYKDYCTYHYYDWPIVQTKSTTGATHEVQWPDLQAVGPDQRLERHERYEVTFQSLKKDKTWKHRPSNYAEFCAYNPGVLWEVKTNVAGSIWPQKPLTPEAPNSK